jgi:hypothetical protein
MVEASINYSNTVLKLYCYCEFGVELGSVSSKDYYKLKNRRGYSYKMNVTLWESHDIHLPNHLAKNDFVF